MNDECEKAFREIYKLSKTPPINHYYGFKECWERYVEPLKESTNYKKLGFLIIENSALEQQNRKLREALEWYADSSKWQDVNPKTFEKYKEGEGIFYLDKEINLELCEGGKKARQALKEIDNE